MPANAKRPNIVLLFSDQQHWQAAGYRDPFFDTPNQNALAKRCTIFENVFCTTPQCSPSRSSIMTGQYPHRTGVVNNINAIGTKDLNQPTIGSMLQEAGYKTGYFGKWHLGDQTVANAGWDERTIQIPDDEISQQATAFLRERANSEQPFATVISYTDPHDVYHFQREQYDVPDDVPLSRSWEEETFASKPDVQRLFMRKDQGKVIEREPREEWQRYRWWYRQVNRRYDEHVGRIMAAMDEANLWDNTIFIVTSDHGDMDTNHRLVWKGPFMYEHLIRVPMLIHVPAQLGGRSSATCNEHIVLTDLVPTMRELAGLSEIKTDGQSLLPLLCNDTNTKWQPRDYVISQYHGKQQWANPMRMIRTERYKYILPRQGKPELYNLQADPDELHNKADDAAHADEQKQMNEQLKKWMQENDDNFDSLQATDREGQAI